MYDINVAMSSKIPKQLQANRLIYSFTGWFFVGIAVLCFVYAILEQPPSLLLMIPGAFFLLFGLVCVLIVSKLPRVDGSENQQAGGNPEKTL